eukprot:TRINITY_DN42912_c0_g1_i1.p1 TRINITY_DN42912_c0_g1~~TRINITY_DN42912_c0_g1_i1.p1  ORF type:complete len:685 (+),score=188.36 TRINITY_DN42912_c0_g1_i1:55-2109(+)
MPVARRRPAAEAAPARRPWVAQLAAVCFGVACVVLPSERGVALLLDPVTAVADRLAPPPVVDPDLRELMATTGLGAYAHLLERDGVGVAALTAGAAKPAGIKPFHWDLLIHAAKGDPLTAASCGAAASARVRRKAKAEETTAAPPAVRETTPEQGSPQTPAPPMEEEKPAEAALPVDAGLPTPAPLPTPCDGGFSLEQGAWYEGERFPPHPTTESATECGKMCAQLPKCLYFVWRQVDKACHRMGTRGKRHPDQAGMHTTGVCATEAESPTNKALAQAVAAAEAGSGAAPEPASAGGGSAGTVVAVKAAAGATAAARRPATGTLTLPICENWARSEGMKSWWAALRKLRGGPAPTMELPRGTAKPPICANSEAEPKKPNEDPEKVAAVKHATVGLSAGQSWHHGEVDVRTIARLRARGVVDQIYVDRDLKLLYCAVPKAACTSTKAWMLKAAGLNYRGNVHNRSLYAGPRLQSAVGIRNEELAAMFNDGGYFKFTLVRNPYTRALASYLERFHNCRQRRSEGECLMWARALVGTSMPKEDVLRLRLTFEQYLRTMHETKRSGEQKLNFMTAHWLPSAQVCAVDELPFDFIGRMESPEDMALLFEVAGERGHDSQSASRLAHSVGTSTKMATYYETDRILRSASTFYRQDTMLLGYTDQGIIPTPRAAGSADSAPAPRRSLRQRD